MSRPSEDDREAVDRAFADLVAGYHLTSDRPDPLLDQAKDQVGAAEPGAEAAPTSTEAGGPQPGWADGHPLFRFVEPPELTEPAPIEDEFVPEPLMPLPRPAWPVLLAWIAMGFAVLAVLVATVGIRLPMWLAWTALLCFFGGFAVLVARLPRNRPPDAGNGAVL